MEVLILPRVKLLKWKTSTISALDRNFRKMAGEHMQGAQSMMDLNFQSFATQNIDQKQMELNVAAAKMDTLTKELENIWSYNTPPASSASSSVASSIGSSIGSSVSSNPGQGKDAHYSTGILGSQDQLGKWNAPSTPALSPSLSHPSNRKLLPPDGGESYLSRSSTAPASLGVPTLTYNPPLSSPVLLSPRAHKKTIDRSTSPRPKIFLPTEPLMDRAQSPWPIPPNYDTLIYSQPGRALSPRPMGMPGPMWPVVQSDHSAAMRQYDYLSHAGQPGRAVSPRPMAPLTDGLIMPQVVFPERVPSPRPAAPQGYENPQVFGSAMNMGSSAFTPFRSVDDQATMRRRNAKTWNESDLDVAYEKKHTQQPNYDRGEPLASFRPQGVPMSGPWRESSLDAAPVPGKDDLYGVNDVATLPRNYKYNPNTSDRRMDPNSWRLRPGCVPGTLPRNWQASQPISRIPIPPTSPQGGQARQQKPIPLSMIFRLQNAFWEQRNPYPMANVQGPPGPAGPGKPQQLQPQGPTPQTLSPVKSWFTSDGNGKFSTLERIQEWPRIPPALRETGELEPEPELAVLLPASDTSQAEEISRPLSPTRLQPILPPEAEKMPEMDEIRRVLADIPRPLKRRGSMEQSVAVPQPSSKKQYQQIMSRLFRRSTPKETAGLVGEGTSPHVEMPIIIEGSETKVGATMVQELPPAPPSPAVSMAPCTPTAVAQSTEIKSVLKTLSSPKKTRARRARLNPLVLLLDAALTGELIVVQQAVKEMSDPSLANEEGITALHNAICGANYEIVDFLINIGVNVNSPDSHGWTPLHCAASCNDTNICMALVKHGAAIFAMTFSDGTMAVEKCDPYREGYKECSSYLTEVEQNMGLVNNGIVYALWDHITEESDELLFRQGDTVTILRQDDQDETEWWWASLYGREGYVPRNYFGLYPRVRAQRST